MEYRLATHDEIVQARASMKRAHELAQAEVKRRGLGLDPEIRFDRAARWRWQDDGGAS